MPPFKIVVRSKDPAIKARREALAERVLAHFGDTLPNENLLCFFDEEDFRKLKDDVGAANRGLYQTIDVHALRFWVDEYWGAWPHYVQECIVDGDERLFDHLIYLHGSSCSKDVGLTMTFAHELQHFVQHGDNLVLWAENTLISIVLRRVLKASDIASLGLIWSDIPIEREARCVSKQSAQALFGAAEVTEYIDGEIKEAGTRGDTADARNWRFMRDLDTSAPYDLERQTLSLFRRLKAYKSQLALVLHHLRSDPAFETIDLDTILG
jgi:hypothetical protein